MGVDYSGGMIVGRSAKDIPYDEEEFECGWEYAEEHGMDCYSLWYDADEAGQVWGFTVKDVVVLSDEFDDWVSMVKRKAEEFEEITGTKAQLIGMQNIW
jgi:hypothetical protein|tara:strand:- start:7650 stop:7946 length:297 start_codon:yes stop_codon:yes gene_type:complete